ncbi:hypothetical protein GCM10026982_24960 [Nocardiopsis aegyptia]
MRISHRAISAATGIMTMVRSRAVIVRLRRSGAACTVLLSIRVTGVPRGPGVAAGTWGRARTARAGAGAGRFSEPCPRAGW